MTTPPLRKARRRRLRKSRRTRTSRPTKATNRKRSDLLRGRMVTRSGLAVPCLRPFAALPEFHANSSRFCRLLRRGGAEVPENRGGPVGVGGRVEGGVADELFP